VGTWRGGEGLRFFNDGGIRGVPVKKTEWAPPWDIPISKHPSGSLKRYSTRNNCGSRLLKEKRHCLAFRPGRKSAWRKREALVGQVIGWGCDNP